MKNKNFPILEKKVLAPQIKLFKIEAPLVAKKAQPGQFIIVRLYEKGERIPLTIADYNPGEGTITLVVQEVGKTTYLLGKMKVGEKIEDVLGPLGNPTPIKKVGVVVCVGGGVGTAELYPEIKKHREVGNEVLTLIGARRKEYLFFQEELEGISTKVRYSTEDGSFGYHGFVTDLLREVLKEHRVDEVSTIGPLPMMKKVVEIIRPLGVKTLVNLNSLMLDGTGMCGCCRVRVGKEVKFTCVDGPTFEGWEVDFEELEKRQRRFFDLEKRALEKCRIR